MTGGLKKYLIFAKSGAQTTIAYRGQIALWFLGGLINAVIMGLLWWAIFEFSPGDTVGGFKFPQMLLYVIMSAVVGQVIYSNTMGDITDDVRFGLIGMRLMKPINYRLQLGFSAVGSFAARLIIIGVPMTAVGTLVAVFGFGLTGIAWYNVLLTVPACFMSALVIDAFEFLFGQLAFRTHAMFGVHSMTEVVLSFLSGAVIPLTLFPVWAQNALYYTPFPTMTSFPVRLFLGMTDWKETLISFAIAVFWIIVLNVIAHFAYKSSVRHVVVFGG